jgi:UDP-2,3-diacylglucosamine pyrophosphatase LpxH
MKVVDGMQYLNCGDWVDSCTAIVEHLNGQMELITWNEASMTTTPVAVSP